MNKKIVTISIIISIMFVAIVTVTSYAYFTMTSNKGEDNTVTTGTMSLHFTDGQAITANGMVPGEHIDKEFSVENTGTVVATYDIYLSEVINGFVDQSDLVYEIISIDGGYNTTNQIQVPSASTKIINGQTIGAGETQHYILRITFLNKDENQDDNQGVYFSAKVNINKYDDINTVVKYYVDNTEVTELPSQNKVSYLNSNCNNNGNITFDEDNWTYNTKVYHNNTVCNIYFNNIVYEYEFDPDGDGLGQEQTFTPSVPGTYKLEVWGAQGASYDDTYNGGYGGYSTGNIILSNEILHIYVGGQGDNTTGGYNGGGNGKLFTYTDSRGTRDFTGYAGGGATDIRLNGTSLNDRIIVAGGGGGSIYNPDYFPQFMAAGGSGGAYQCGGGGGGLYGGGGGGHTTEVYSGGGGGGSSYISDSLDEQSQTAGVREGHGYAVITFVSND